MGGILSSATTDPNTPSSNSTIPTGSLKSDSQKTPEVQTPKHLIDPQLNTKTGEEEKHQKDEGESDNILEQEEEGEEEGECGFCVWMKQGGCRESFTAWQECVIEYENNKEEEEENDEGVAEACAEVTLTLRKCMKSHPEYYDPIVRAEKAAAEGTVKEVGKEKETSERSEQHLNSIEKKRTEEENGSWESEKRVRSLGCLWILLWQ